MDLAVPDLPVLELMNPDVYELEGVIQSNSLDASEIAQLGRVLLSGNDEG